jgi:hypothetical protein
MWWLLVVGVIVVVGVALYWLATRRKRQGNVTDELAETFKFSPPF